MTSVGLISALYGFCIAMPEDGLYRSKHVAHVRVKLIHDKTVLRSTNYVNVVDLVTTTMGWLP